MSSYICQCAWLALSTYFSWEFRRGLERILYPHEAEETF